LSTRSGGFKVDIQTNGSFRLDGGTEDHGGAQVIPMTIGNSGGEGTPFTEAVVETQSSLHEQVEGKMQELRSKAAALDQSAQQQQSAMGRYDARLQGIEQEVMGIGRQVQSADGRVQGVEQVLTELGEQLTALTRTLDELRGKVSDVTTSIGEMNQEIGSLRETAIPPIKEDVEILKALPRVGSSTWLKIVVFLIIVVGGYSIIGKPGWSTVVAMLPPSVAGLF
jgi:uncharacterized coiled-coil protein SlyX